LKRNKASKKKSRKRFKIKVSFNYNILKKNKKKDNTSFYFKTFINFFFLITLLKLRKCKTLNKYKNY